MRSTTTPHSAHTASAAAIASGQGQPRLTLKVNPITAPSIMVLPWAKLTVFDTA